MAEPLTATARRVLLGCCLLCAVAAGPAIAAEALPDPTRPSASLAAGAAMSVPSSGPVLQSVLIAAGRRVAVISEQTVQVGDKVGEAQVVSIAEGEVVLRSGGQLQTLKVFPGIEKRPTNGGISAKHR